MPVPLLCNIPNPFLVLIPFLTPTIIVPMPIPQTRSPFFIGTIYEPPSLGPPVHHPPLISSMLLPRYLALPSLILVLSSVVN
ncbi:hypothetical protein ONZ51_g2135 [Trametes cubensis]|uniref:Uncharacterized protein n=1 Tax=Trametes cubensis TaxID=1111947 RepID=A0AAD7U0U8_9APHY|nr:hypothetical protein ONZ51_g2135 [Trametes cubensis]